MAATDDPQALDAAVGQAAGVLKAGGVVALPTETVYGLAANALDASAVARIFAAKERPAFDPLIVHVRSLEHVAEVAEIPAEFADVIGKIAAAHWPGPLTILLPKKPNVPDITTSGLPTVAVRVPADPVFRRVLKECRFPLAAPSANRFGRISPTSASAVMKELSGRIPLVLDGGACSEGLESTIIRLVPQDKRPRIEILRPGPVTKEMLQVFGQVKILKGGPTPEAPGRLPSHYAPKTPFRLVESLDDWEPEPGRRYALLSYSGDPTAGYTGLTDWAHIISLSPGNGKLHEASIRLFHVMRQLDELGVDEIISEPVSEVGLGVAIMDRLRKASGPRD